MATNQALTMFVAWAPYCTDAGTKELRLAVRPTHLANLERLTKEGIIRKHPVAACLPKRRNRLIVLDGKHRYGWRRYKLGIRQRSPR